MDFNFSPPYAFGKFAPGMWQYCPPEFDNEVEIEPITDPEGDGYSAYYSWWSGPATYHAAVVDVTSGPAIGTIRFLLTHAVLGYPVTELVGTVTFDPVVSLRVRLTADVVWIPELQVFARRWCYRYWTGSAWSDSTTDGQIFFEDWSGMYSPIFNPSAINAGANFSDPHWQSQNRHKPFQWERLDLGVARWDDGIGTDVSVRFKNFQWVDGDVCPMPPLTPP